MDEVHLHEASRTVLHSPALAAAYQLRAVEMCHKRNYEFPQQAWQQMCTKCSVPYLPGVTLQSRLQVSHTGTRAKGGLNKRQRQKKKSPRKLWFVQKCLKCQYAVSTEVERQEKEKREPNLVHNQDDKKKLSTGQSAKKRAKQRKNVSSLQNMVNKKKQNEQKSGLNLDDFMKL